MVDRGPRRNKSLNRFRAPWLLFGFREFPPITVLLRPLFCNYTQALFPHGSEESLGLHINQMSHVVKVSFISALRTSCVLLNIGWIEKILFTTLYDRCEEERRADPMLQRDSCRLSNLKTKLLQLFTFIRQTAGLAPKCCTIKNVFFKWMQNKYASFLSGVSSRLQDMQTKTTENSNNAFSYLLQFAVSSWQEAQQQLIFCVWKK